MPRRRFGRYEVIDFLAVQIALRQKFRAHAGDGSHERLQPFAIPSMALFDRERLPSRSALSR